MALLTLLDAELAHGDVPLLDRAQLTLLPGERLGLIGRNGSGKSSLLQVIAGRATLDAGELQRRDGLAVVLVEQEPELPAAPTLHDSLLLRGHVPALADERRRWQVQARLAEYLQRLGVDGSLRPATASGGERKRAALALAFALEPDLLLLDEPTNHLDIGAIERLEDLVLRAPAAIVITHDRRFLDRVATRIVELDRGVLRSYPGAYSAFEQARERELDAQALANARADKLLAQEEVWIRKGVEARRTRSVSRVARLQALRQQRAQRREQLGQVRLELDSGAPSGKIVAELQDVSLRHGPDQAWLVRRFSSTILRGDKVGLIGPNGAGKTSLLRLILGQAEPTEGRIRRGTQLQVAYFDQMRAGLDLDATLADTISPGSEWIEINGTRKHVMGYLGDFLFAPERANSPVRTLSGGERNRLLLARLFALPANVLVLDEPTNDLDIDTLELLEELLQQYRGTVFLVSHDRRFVDAVVTSTIAWEGDPAQGGQPGLWREYEGGIEDWILQRDRARAVQAASSSAGPPPGRSVVAAPMASPAGSSSASPPPVRRKLGYKEQRELEALPGLIDQLETEQRTIADLLADGSLFSTDRARATALSERSAAIEDELMKALERWEELGSR